MSSLIYIFDRELDIDTNSGEFSLDLEKRNNINGVHFDVFPKNK